MSKSKVSWRYSCVWRSLAIGTLVAGISACESGGSTNTSFNASNSPLSTNVVANSGLESDVELEGWSAYTNGDTAQAEFSVDSSEYYKGTHSFMAMISALGDQPYHIEGGPVDVPVTPGESYQLIAWAKGPAESKLNFTASMSSEPWTTYASVESVQTGEWQQIKLLVTVPEDHPSSVIRLPIQMNFAENEGATFYVDDVQLVPVTLPDNVPVDMVRNGSLEESDTAYPGWGGSADGTNAAGTTFGISTVDAYDGNNAFQVSFGTILASADPWNVEAGPSNVPVVEGVTYRLSAWYKGTVGATANLGVQLQESPWHTFASQEIVATGDWQLVTFDAEIVEAAAIDNYEGPTTAVRLYSQMGYEGNSGGEFFFDEFRFLTPEAELVSNGDLEESDSSYPGWGASADATAAAGTTFEISTDGLNDANNSFHVSFGTILDTADPWNVEAGPSNVPVIEGQTYTYTAWYRGTPGATANINVQLQGSPWHAYASQQVIADSEWQVVSFDVLIAEADTIENYEGPTTAVRLFAQMGYEVNTDAEIFFDNVSLVAKSTGSEQ